MLVLCYEISMRILRISRLSDEITPWNKRFSSLYQCLLLRETKNRKSNFMLILCLFYAGFMHRWDTIDASCCQKPKIENLILCWFYVHFMLVLCYKILMQNLSISRLIDEIAHWNKRFSSLYQCLLLPETKNRKSNFMLILCSFYAGFMLQDFDAKFEHISAHRWDSPLK